MNYLIEAIFLLLVAFFISIIIGKPIINFIKKKKANQPILNYVENHNSKSGTPTMGGIIFLFSFLATTIFFVDGYVRHIYICIIFMLVNTSVGIYDDILKIRNKQNEGLKPWQKLIVQFISSLLFGLYLYYSGLTYLIIPFSKISINLKFWIVPIVVIVAIFFVNCSNLTDGLDGLDSFIACVVSVALGVILWLISRGGVLASIKITEFYQNFAIVLQIFFGAILGYIFYNCYPAKIFMGDTGSLSIGAFLVAVSFATGTIIFLLLFGIMYIASGVSVLLQVAYYKLTKKRIFLMAPLHHHFELKKIHESKITTVYTMVTLIVSLLVILIELKVVFL